jgi:Fe-S oxidoreductase
MSEKGKQHVDSCRFCWMCHHICPIGNATGQERNTARARALGISLVNREAIELSEIMDNIFECACCGACTKECVTGWDPVMFTKETRLNAAMEDKLPDYINVLVDNCINVGNAYGITEIDADLKKAIAAHSAKTDILLFLGVDALYKAPKSAINAIKVLEKAGVNFTVLEKEPASGAQLEYLISAAGETKEQMINCAKELNNFATVVAFDPQDAKVLKREYKEWDIALNAEVKTFTAFVAGLLKSGALKAENSGKKVVFQDPFQLSRDLGETEEAREIISAYAVLDEMLCNRKDTMWAGNILMAQWIPDVMNRVAEDRMNNARGVKADTIVTASVSEYTSLKAVEKDVKVISIEELILG